MAEPLKPHAPLITRRLLAGLLLGIGLLAWALFPTQRDLLERQMRDGFSAKALATLQKMSPRERRKRPEYYALAELRLRRELLNAKNPTAVRQQLIAACTAAEQFNFKPEFAQELRALIALVPAVEELCGALQPFLPRMPLDLRRSLFDALVARALAVSNPELAARTIAEFWASSPGDSAAATEMVRLWRLAGQPAQALAAIEAHAQRTGGNLARTSPMLARLRIDLLRETGEAGKAYAAAWELAQVSGAAERAELFGLLVATARESGQGAAILAEVRRRAEAAPNDEQAWRMLAELALGAGRADEALAAVQRLLTLRPGEKADVLRAAQIAEWAGRPDVAFDLYLQALKLKEPAAIERLLALNPGLYRDTDLAAALARAGNLVDGEKHGLMLARLQVSVGSYDEARAAYERLVQQPRAPIESFKEYGRLLLDLQDYPRAGVVFGHAEKMNPRDLPTQRALAEVSFRLGRFDEAFARYQRLLGFSPDAEALENFVALADSLGRTDAIVLALRRNLDLGTNVTAVAYHRLAHYQGLIGQTGEMGRTLREGLARFPRDHALRVQLVYELVQEQRIDEAIQLLAPHPELRTSVDLVQLNLDLLTQAGRKGEAEQFLASVTDNAILQSTSVQAMVARMRQKPEPTPSTGATTAGAVTPADIARLYRENPNDPSHAAEFAKVLLDLGRIKEAEQVLRPFLAQPTPVVMQAAALMYSAQGNFRRAESFQRRYLETQPEDRARALAYLGDILSARGDKTGARQWYQRGLTEFFRTFAQQTKR